MEELKANQRQIMQVENKIYDTELQLFKLMRSVRILCIALVVLMFVVGIISVVTLRVTQDERTLFQREVFCDVYDVFNEVGSDKKPPPALKCGGL